MDNIASLAPHLYAFTDTCRVYVIRSGDEAVLIDFGAGDVLDHLAEMGVTRVTDVLMTHHHRDQGQGLERAAAAGIRIWAPEAEQDLFRDVAAHWQARPIYNDYNMRQDRFSLLEPVPVAGVLRDYARLRFGDYRVTVIPTPGHTPGSVSFLVEIDGRRVAFTGDLIAAPGKVWSLAATQWSYNQAEGVAYSIASLADLKARQPDLLLPAHGEPMPAPAAALDLLAARLYALLDARGNNPRLRAWIEHPYCAITPHVLQNVTAMACSYVLLSASGKALLIDFGYDMLVGLAAGNDRAARRPWLYTLPALHRDYGVRHIDAVIPTHFHDDHVAGCNLLRAVEGSEVWAAANFAAILENPAAYNLPCLWYDPIPVDRVLPLGTPIRWEEYELALYPQPGHTRYAAAIVFEADGRRFLCSGDEFAEVTADAWNYVYHNGFEPDDYRRTVDLYRVVAPDCILSGHWGAHWVEPGYLDRLAAGAQALERLHRDLLPAETGECTAEGGMARITPYQATAFAGEPVALAAEVLNPLSSTATVTIRPVAPAGWTVEPAQATLQLAGRAAGTAPFRVTPPPGESARRARVAVDVTIGGRRLGQQAEALVTVC